MRIEGRRRAPPRESHERSKTMGATHVTVTIRNPAEPDRCWEGLFLVDAGATDSLVPRPHLEAIGLEPRGRRVYELADGNEIAMDIAVGEIEFMGETVGGTILFGAADAEPLLGVTALESVGIEVDPLNQKLKRLPAVRLKGMPAAGRSRWKPTNGSRPAIWASATGSMRSSTAPRRRRGSCGCRTFSPSCSPAASVREVGERA